MGEKTMWEARRKDKRERRVYLRAQA